MKIGNKRLMVNKKIVSITLLIMLLTIIGGVSYAYFTASVTGNETAKDVEVEAGTMSLKLDGTTITSLNNALPGSTHTIKFTVENTGTLPTTYSLTMINVLNTFYEGDPNDLVYSITSTNGGGIKEETIAPQTNGTLIPVIAIAPSIIQEYELTIHFKETGDNQNDNQNKIFTGKIQINNNGDSNYLSSRVIESNDLKVASTVSQTTLAQAVENSILTPENFKAGSSVEETGVYASEDDDGTSYYLRGVIENNYIDLGTKYTEGIDIYITGLNGNGLSGSFQTLESAEVDCDTYYSISYGYASADICKQNIVHYTKDVDEPLLWRVVRINGDGTIRLIAEDKIGESAFNDKRMDERSVGYTYDNEKICTSVNPCDSKAGTNSIIKDYLETWYEANKNLLETIGVESRFCNDASGGVRDRVYTNGTPTLKCPDADKTYGGTYKLKVGLLSADEIMMAGYGRVHNPANYLYKAYDSLSLSLYPIFPDPYIYFSVASIISYGFITGPSGSGPYTFGVRPVINIKADAIITSGDGTQANPYKIS